MSQQSIPSLPTTITSTDATLSIAESSITTESLTPSRSLHEHKARHEQRTKKVLQIKETISLTVEDEITIYFFMPIARENKNPLDWWKAKQVIFPILSIIARKYLGIPATSVASERLFSDAENHVKAKRNSLNPNLLAKMLFLKRNMQTIDHINVFPSDLVDLEKGDVYLSEWIVFNI